MGRRALPYLGTLLLWGGAASCRAQAPTAAAPTAAAAITPRAEISYVTSDSWTIRGTYQAAASGRDTLLLLHGAGQSRRIWRGMERAFKIAGYGFLAVDLRGHGQSTMGPGGAATSFRSFKMSRRQNDFILMMRDVEGAMAYLAGAGVPSSRVGLVGAYVGASLALRYGVLHPEIPFVVMLDPGMSYENVPVVNAMRAYRGRPILLVYSTQDRTSARAVPILYEFAKRSAGSERAALLPVTGRKLLRPPVIHDILSWIADPVSAGRNFAVIVSSLAAAAQAAAQASVQSPSSPASTSAAPVPAQLPAATGGQ